MADPTDQTDPRWLEPADLALIRFYLGMAWEHIPAHVYDRHGDELAAIYAKLDPPDGNIRRLYMRTKR
jgi:hypothetical protein